MSSNLGRGSLWDALTKHLFLKSGGLPTVAQQLAPVIVASNLDDSATPPYVPFEFTFAQAATVGQWGFVSMFLDPTVTPNGFRVLIEEVTALCAAGENTVLWGVLEAFSTPAGTASSCQLTSFADMPPQTGGNTQLQLFLGDIIVKFGPNAADPFAGFVGTARGLPATTTWFVNKVRWTLGKGHQLIIRAQAVNEVFGIRLRGRAYPSV